MREGVGAGAGWSPLDLGHPGQWSGLAVPAGGPAALALSWEGIPLASPLHGVWDLNAVMTEAVGAARLTEGPVGLQTVALHARGAATDSAFTKVVYWDGVYGRGQGSAILQRRMGRHTRLSVGADLPSYEGEHLISDRPGQVRPEDNLHGHRGWAAVERPVGGGRLRLTLLRHVQKVGVPDAGTHNAAPGAGLLRSGARLNTRQGLAALDYARAQSGRRPAMQVTASVAMGRSKYRLFDGFSEWRAGVREEEQPVALDAGIASARAGGSWFVEGGVAPYHYELADSMGAGRLSGHVRAGGRRGLGALALYFSAGAYVDAFRGHFPVARAGLAGPAGARAGARGG